MAWVLLLHENEVQDKHVESVWFPRLDEGSNPSSSTLNEKERTNQLFALFIYQIYLFVVEICFLKCVLAAAIKTMCADHILWKPDSINERF